MSRKAEGIPGRGPARRRPPQLQWRCGGRMVDGLMGAASWPGHALRFCRAFALSMGLARRGNGGGEYYRSRFRPFPPFLTECPGDRSQLHRAPTLECSPLRVFDGYIIVMPSPATAKLHVAAQRLKVPSASGTPASPLGAAKPPPRSRPPPGQFSAFRRHPQLEEMLIELFTLMDENKDGNIDEAEAAAVRVRICGVFLTLSAGWHRDGGGRCISEGVISANVQRHGRESSVFCFYTHTHKYSPALSAQHMLLIFAGRACICDEWSHVAAFR